MQRRSIPTSEQMPADFQQTTRACSHTLFFSSPPPSHLGLTLPVPTIAPGNVQAESVNSTTIRFTWTAPNPQFINGINQGYKVSWCRAVGAEHVVSHILCSKGGGAMPRGQGYLVAAVNDGPGPPICQSEVIVFIFAVVFPVLLWSCEHVMMNVFIILSWAFEYSPSLCLLRTLN